MRFTLILLLSAVFLALASAQEECIDGYDSCTFQCCSQLGGTPAYDDNNEPNCRGAASDQIKQAYQVCISEECTGPFLTCSKAAQSCRFTRDTCIRNCDVDFGPYTSKAECMSACDEDAYKCAVEMDDAGRMGGCCAGPALILFVGGLLLARLQDY